MSQKISKNKNSAASTIKLLHDFLKRQHKLILGISGPLGVGKTHFTRQMLQVFDKKLAFEVKSPTFSYCNIYEGSIRVSHLDLYRLQSDSDLDRIAIWDYITFSDVVVVEWIDKFPKIFNSCDFLLEILWSDGDLRRYLLTKL